MTLRKGTWNALFFYAKNVKGDSFNVVTIHPAVTGRATFIYPGMNVLEYSGAEKTSPLVTDIAGTEGSLPGTWSSSPFNAAAGELVVMGIVTANGGAYTEGAGFKIEDAYQTTASTKFSVGVTDQVAAAAQRE